MILRTFDIMDYVVCGECVFFVGVHVGGESFFFEDGVVKRGYGNLAPIQGTYLGDCSEFKPTRFVRRYNVFDVDDAGNLFVNNDLEIGKEGIKVKKV